MRKFGSVLAILLVLFVLFPSKGHAKNADRYIGLHDRMLPIVDVRIVNGQTIVPLEQFASYLYVDVENTKEGVRLTKGDIQLSFKTATGETTNNGLTIKSKPIVRIGNDWYVGVISAAQELGFQTHYFSAEKTIRIFRSTIPHMTHADFAKKTIAPYLKRQANKKATVYLTFDDGPNIYTRANAETLKKYGAKGTFFFLGNHLKRNEPIVQFVANEGHYIGSHSMSHNQKLVYRNADSFYKEMHDAARLIEKQTGKAVKLIRVPYGSKPHVTTAMRNKLKQNGYKMWDWNVDSNDWRYSKKQAQQIVKNVQTGVTRAYQSGERDIIVLLHDIAPTAQVLPQLIEWLQKEGYSLETYSPHNHIIQNFHHDQAL